MPKGQLLELLFQNGTSPRIISAFGEVPREEFVPPQYKELAYQDDALPIGQGQTISQPSLVAMMLEELKLNGREKILEIGTGSGYQTALLSKLASKIYSIERIKSLAEQSKKRLRALKIKNTQIFIGDGSLGLPEKAPFDAIIVTAAFKKVPQSLISQLKDGGRLVMPVGERDSQEAVVYQKLATRLVQIKNIGPVRFVPLIGKEAWRKNFE